MRVKDRPQCYFDVELNRDPVGRIVFQLYSDICPKTSKNFLCLCTGERGSGKVTGKKLCYKGSTFHRVVKNFMIQGGDFTEGTGRGGESIYGGYFKDENFILKHDRAFLLSMANRGKDTNGSQFFITTKTAPHLDGVHVVFGLVISGFEIIKKIEGLKTDSASRPYADVRVVDCGQLITKSANDVLEDMRTRGSTSPHSSLNSDNGSSNFSSEESESPTEQKRKRQKLRRPGKSKPPKKKKREAKKAKSLNKDILKKRPVEQETVPGEPEEEKESGGKREKPVVRPEEIPPVPENRFLLRRDMPSQQVKTEIVEKKETTVSAEQKPAVSKSGRTIRGRGTIRYHTPTRSKSRSASVEEHGSSETPPHWKEEMKRTKCYQRPSVERWNKGDKWDDRSDSAWSHSAEHSTDHSSERSSPHQHLKREKKAAKHKKKAKKRKHAKKKSFKSKPPKTYVSDNDKAVSSERSSRRSHSLSRSLSSQHHLPKRRRRSTRSFSQSYSRSYTRSRSTSRGRSRSHSRSRSISRSRSRCLSRSRSRSISQSRSDSRSRHRSRTLSKKRSSSKKRKTRAPNSDGKSRETEKIPEVKVTAGNRLPTVPTPESVPVMPLSDSPPPSRWKPGQKPWKPSYIHIQEIKAKVASNMTSSGRQAMDRLTEKAQSSGTPKSIANDGHGAHKATRRLSRSRSLNRSRSRSSSRYRSRSSSFNGSELENSPRTSSRKANSLDKEWEKYCSSVNRIKNVVSLSGGRGGLSGSDKGTGSEHSRDNVDFMEKIKETENAQHFETNHSLPAGRSEWDSDGDKVSQSESFGRTKLQKEDDLLPRGKSALAGWNSDSDSENVAGRKSAVSEKEEGEASSESDCDASKKTFTHKVAAPSSGRSEESCGNCAAPEKHKSKKKAKRKHKHKRRGDGKTSHHSKDKGKNSKRKKLKLKESFHWQPPLEFGEEDEEDESKREKSSPPNVSLEDSSEPMNVNDQHLTSLKINPNNEVEKGQPRSKETTRNSKNPEPHHQPSDKNSTSSHCSGTKEPQTLDDMDICTPEHNIDILEPLPSNDSAISEPNPRATSKSSNVTSNEGSSVQSNQQPTASSTATDESPPGGATAAKPSINFKWRPIKVSTALQDVSATPVTVKHNQESQNRNVQGVKMEIKSKSRVRPGSLFDEVRKTARLNQRPRNQESSSEESSPVVGKTRETARSLQKARSQSRNSRSASSQRSGSRGWSRSYSRSRSRSRSSSYSSRSRSRSRRRHRRGRSRSRSSTYRSYRSHRGHSRSYSRSLSRSRSYHRHRSPRSDSYDSYTSRSRSGSRRRRRSDSYRSSGRRSRSYHSSSRSSSRRRSHSRYS
ncbi:NK-tumor recognition protein isoform X2 [Oryzias latipes]|uniref:NK-tumor recognition protein isoform X2 n=1 Tax=Oryzias latipes TaxID=8090 RepID=UPI0009DA27FE|nr:NK-tumor recognition protein isoform X2 [Oryzias latipes]